MVHVSHTTPKETNLLGYRFGKRWFAMYVHLCRFYSNCGSNSYKHAGAKKIDTNRFSDDGPENVIETETFDAFKKGPGCTGAKHEKVVRRDSTWTCRGRWHFDFVTFVPEVLKTAIESIN